MISEQELKEWHSIQKEMARMKAREMNLRKAIVADIMTGVATNSKTVELFGLELKAEVKTSDKVDMVILNEVGPNLNPAEKACLKWTATIIAKPYKELPGSSVLRTRVVTVKPAAPSLKVISVLE